MQNMNISYEVNKMDRIEKAFAGIWLAAMASSGITAGYVISHQVSKPIDNGQPSVVVHKDDVEVDFEKPTAPTPQTIEPK